MVGQAVLARRIARIVVEIVGRVGCQSAVEAAGVGTEQRVQALRPVPIHARSTSGNTEHGSEQQQAGIT